MRSAEPRGESTATPKLSRAARVRRMSSPGADRLVKPPSQAGSEHREDSTSARCAKDLDGGTGSAPVTGFPGRRPRRVGLTGWIVAAGPLGHTRRPMNSSAVYFGRHAALAGLKQVASGKVRDIYELDARHLLFVTSDRVSAFDVVMREGIAHKGRVLTAISTWWFEHTRDVIANHLVSTSIDDVPGLDGEWKDKLRGRIMVVRRAEPTTVEWVVRGYLAGSGFKEYKSRGSICGVALPPGLEQASRLPKPILTPTTKEEHHDLPLSPEEARERVGPAVFDPAHRAALALFARASEVLEAHGILLADTKFEFGLLEGRLILIDEALTPDSSRFWPRDQWKPGSNPPSYDKQILRDWLEAQPWNKEPPPPSIAPEILERTSARYLEVCKKITGRLPEGVTL